MRVGKIREIAVKIHWCFLLIAGVFIAAGLQEKVCAVFFSVILHEAAHVIMARHFGYQVKEVELLPFGGVARIERLWESERKNVFAVAAAGPIVSLLIAGGAFLLVTAGIEEMRLMMNVNLVLGAFNLLPAFPLDGGQIFRVFFRCFVSYRDATRYIVVMSIMVCMAMMGKLFYDFIFFQELNLSYGLMSGFICASARKEVKASDFHSVKVMAYKKADLQRKGYMETAYYVVEKRMKVKAVMALFNSEKYCILVILDEKYKICASYTEIEAWEAIAEKGMEVSFSDLLS